mmetsp:Transcript_13578/g.33299  ORF Transcript_13578/g.33299 Transcript_13578/m.33299 type:complete len:437 (+) Transcript_13578:106-1416(+)
MPKAPEDDSQNSYTTASTEAAMGGEGEILSAGTKRLSGQVTDLVADIEPEQIDAEMLDEDDEPNIDQSTLGELRGPPPPAPPAAPERAAPDPVAEGTPEFKRRRSSMGSVMSEGFVPAYELEPHEIEFGEKLGSGAMGHVFVATYRGERVAAKTLIGVEKMMEKKDKRYKDLMMELEVMNHVGKHPHCVSFIGAVTMSKPIIVMELVNGPTLEAFLHPHHGPQPGSLRRETVAGWSRGLLAGVAHLHSREPMILHRDLKPDNLILTSDLEMLKILDFGVGKKMKKSGSFQRIMTACTGTRRYMAPEVYSSVKGNYNEKADVYSCALIIWEIQTGKKPFDGPEGRFLQQKTMREVMRPSVTVGFEWNELGPLLERAWHVDPKERPPAAELVKLMEGLGGAPPKDAPASPLEYDGMLMKNVDVDEMKLPKCHSGCTIS